MTVATVELLMDRLGAIATAIHPDATGVDAVRRLSGGAVNEIWAFDLPLAGGGTMPLVLRRADGAAARSQSDALMPLAQEAAVIARAGESGVPVATPRYCLAPGDGLGEGFVSDRIDGETIGGRIARAPQFETARRTLAHRCGTVLARIHQTDPAGLGPLETRDAATFLDKQEAIYRRLGGPRPVLALAFRWLRAHLPADERACLVHGDFRNGNIIVGEDGLRAVLDWEGAHFSDPMSDLGFLCVRSWRFGVMDRPVGGFGAREDLYAGYEEAGGTIDRASLHYWETFGTLRWALMCAEMADGGVLGASPIEAALIARRTSESELDLLDLMTGTEI